jgi:NAD(P)-dependent dehydrogenase (short-subunit alcohol dehydrogenase family)
VVEVNLAAAFFASQAVLPVMRAQGGRRKLPRRWLFLATTRGSYIHGLGLVVDGGYIIHWA